jgi:hypothetical protein
LDADFSIGRDVGLEIVSDVRVDPDAPMLSFEEKGVPRSYWVDAKGILALRMASDRYAPIVELKLDEGEGRVHNVLLAPCDQRGPGHWGIARMIRLDQFVVPDKEDAFRSALSQVCSELAELQYDIRQPLAAISLAAHNGPGLFRAGMADQAVAKFARILEQVDHCEARMQRRIAGFGADAPGAVVLPFVPAIYAAILPVREWMATARTMMLVSGVLPSGSVRVLPGAIETLLRYILKDLTEKVRYRRAVRVVDIVLGEDVTALRLMIRYRRRPERGGTAADDSTLEAAQRIMEQMGGDVLVPTIEERKTGVAATLLFPRCAQADADRADQLALASSLR